MNLTKFFNKIEVMHCRMTVIHIIMAMIELQFCYVCLHHPELKFKLDLRFISILNFTRLRDVEFFFLVEDLWRKCENLQ